MADEPRIESIAGLRFNERGVVVPETQIQATWSRAVAAARRPEQKQEQDADGLAERRWSQR